MKSNPPAGGPEKFKKNTVIVLSFLWIWTVLGAAHILFFTQIRQKKLLHESQRLAWRTGVLPAVRGTILGENGKVLAETKIFYNLVITRNAAPQKRWQAATAAVDCLELKGKFILTPGEPLTLSSNLSPKEIRKLLPVLKKFSELQIIPEHRRIVTNDPQLRSRIGLTDKYGHGISGLEKEYEQFLSGRNGSFTVMLDRSGRWVPGTIRAVKQPQHGKNIRLRTDVL